MTLRACLISMCCQKCREPSAPLLDRRLRKNVPSRSVQYTLLEFAWRVLRPRDRALESAGPNRLNGSPGIAFSVSRVIVQCVRAYTPAGLSAGSACQLRVESRDVARRADGRHMSNWLCISSSASINLFCSSRRCLRSRLNMERGFGSVWAFGAGGRRRWFARPQCFTRSAASPRPPTISFQCMPFRRIAGVVSATSAFRACASASRRVATG
jgi:hypothetical protein